MKLCSFLIVVGSTVWLFFNCSLTFSFDLLDNGAKLIGILLNDSCVGCMRALVYHCMGSLARESLLLVLRSSL